ncbi:putative capsular polysacharide biosynthesis transferase [Enterobacter hormaechei]|uniref:serine acetyltransferase n=1 Tax=Enterobacter hormaechei TaxID=158836 RepID=UPI000796BD14|nr:serine acetyltransferase [Enterobacter hormaechei]SAC97863.1 putative capsular polysacharide biosynthesis transferase [Enterobacter hormaechei]
MTSKRGFFTRAFNFFKRKFFSVMEFFYSYRFYRSLKLPMVNHLTIGIDVLGKKNTFLPHPLGIVIGKNVKIGSNCTIYQNVTIGVSNNKNEDYPVIGDNVIIYASAIVIGKVIIENDAVIGAGCIVTKNVPANKIAIGSPMRLLDKKCGVDY